MNWTDCGEKLIRRGQILLDRNYSGYHGHTRIYVRDAFTIEFS